MSPNTFFFLDVASLFYGVLLVLSLSVLLYVSCVGLLGYYLGGYAFFSYTHRAAIIRLIEHGITSIGGGLLMLVGIGWRVGFEHYSLSF